MYVGLSENKLQCVFMVMKEHASTEALMCSLVVFPFTMLYGAKK